MRCAIILLLSRIFRALPLGWVLRVGRAFGWFWYYVVPVRRSVAARNLRRALGAELTRREQRRILRGCFANLGMYGAELLRLPAMTPELSERLVRREGWERLEAALARGRGVIVATAHIGNWDLFGCTQAIRGTPLHVIVKDISWKPAHEFAFAVRHRCGFGTIAPRRSKHEIVEILNRGEIVAMIVDQHMPAHRAIVCELFGQLAATTPAPARFAFQTGAAIVPAVCYRDGDSGHHVVYIEPELVLETPYDDLDANIRHNTERLNRILEGWIRRAPQQWLWLHRRWKVQDNPRGWEIPPSLTSRLDGPGAQR